MEINDEYRQYEVTYKFYLPDNKDDLKTFQNALFYETALHDIYDRCRRVWKYEENPTEDKVKFAELIGEIIGATGVFDE